MRELMPGCETLVRVCADLKPGEQALVVSDTGTREIGEALGVAKVLEGSVRRSGERIRVTPTPQARERCRSK